VSDPQPSNLIITINHGEIHAMPEVNWENIRAKCLEKGVSPEQVERCIRCDGVPEGMQLEFM
jgi:hypothetical protein